MREELHARVQELEARVVARRAAIATARRHRPHWVFFVPLAIGLASGFAVAFRSAPPKTTRAAAMREDSRVSTEAAAVRCEETKSVLERRMDDCSDMVLDLARVP